MRRNYEYSLLLPRSAAPAARPRDNAGGQGKPGVPPYSAASEADRPLQSTQPSLSPRTAYTYQPSNSVHFRPHPLRPVSCYALLSRCQLPWPRPGCLEGARTFRWSFGLFWHVKVVFGLSHSTSSAYQRWSTTGKFGWVAFTPAFSGRGSTALQRAFEVWKEVESARPPVPLTMSLRHATPVMTRATLRGISGGTSY